MTALVVASFAEAGPFRVTVARLAADRRRIVGLWSPCAVELGELGAATARPIAPAAILGGLGAAAVFYALIWWSAVHAYPFDSGARPLHAWQVFLIPPIEFGALAAALIGGIVFLVAARLTRLHDSAFDLEEVARASCDRFVIALACDAGPDANDVIAMFGEAGAVHSRLVTA